MQSTRTKKPYNRSQTDHRMIAKNACLYPDSLNTKKSNAFKVDGNRNLVPFAFYVTANGYGMVWYGMEMGGKDKFFGIEDSQLYGFQH